MSLVNRNIVYFIISLAIYITSSVVLTPTDSTADGNFHMASIYCATDNQQICREGEYINEVLVIQNLMPQRCQDYELKYLDDECKSTQNSWTKYYSNVNEYPKTYYNLMSFFIIDQNPKISLYIIRAVNSIFFIVVSLLILFISNKKDFYAFSLTHVLLSGIWGEQFYFTHNPSSWTMLGFTAILLFSQTKLDRKNLNKAILALICVVAMSYILINSRPDGKIYLALALFVVIILKIIKYKNRIKSISMLALLMVITYISFSILDSGIGIFESLTNSINGFDFMNSYTDNYTISQTNLLIHNLILSPVFILGFFGMDNSLNDIIPSLIYSLPLTVLTAYLIRLTVPRRRFYYYITSIIALVFFIYLLFAKLDYLFIYDKNIGYRYFMPIVAIFMIYAFKENGLVLQKVKPTILLISLFALVGQFLKIKQFDEGFVNGVYVVLPTEFRSDHYLSVYILFAFFAYSHYSLIKSLILKKLI
jgi:hypothetical protein